MSSDMSTWLYRNQRSVWRKTIVVIFTCRSIKSKYILDIYILVTFSLFVLLAIMRDSDEKIMQTFHPNAPCKLSPLWKCNWFINVITRLAFISSRVMVTLENHIRIYVCRYATGIHDTYILISFELNWNIKSELIRIFARGDRSTSNFIAFLDWKCSVKVIRYVPVGNILRIYIIYFTKGSM